MDHDPAHPTSLFTVLSLLPSGNAGTTPLDPDEMSRYLAREYGTTAESLRNQRHALRDELYRDGGDGKMSEVLNDQFRDPVVRELRKKWIPYAKFNNPTRRIVNELSTVYSEPAKRFVAGELDNERYQALLEMICIDQRMVEVSRLANLHRTVLVGFRVSQLPIGGRDAVLDVITPTNVRAIMHPNDNTMVVAWMIRTDFRSARENTNAPKWIVWSEYESFYLRDDLSVIGDSVKAHEFGVIPYVPVALGPPAPGFWPGNEGDDLSAAHVSIWVNNILLLKESKSATKQSYVTGDGTSMTTGQPMDTESVGHLPDGHTVNTVDMSMDLDMFSRTTNHILQHVAQNYGLSPALIEHQGVQSAEARELMRLPLKEIRRWQQLPFRLFELNLAIVMAAVTRIDMPDKTFDPSGQRTEFAESETPLDPVAEQSLFESRRTAGLDNTIDMWKRRHPGATDDEAKAAVELNYVIETWRVQQMKSLMALNGSVSSPPGEPTPQQNGAQGRDTVSQEQQPQEQQHADPPTAPAA